VIAAGPSPGPVIPNFGQGSACVTGDRATAVQLLRSAFTEGKPYDLTLHIDRALEPLRGYDAFDRLLLPAD